MESDYETELMRIAVASETVKEAAITNIQGNIEILLESVSPLSPEYVKLRSLQEMVNEIAWRDAI